MATAKDFEGLWKNVAGDDSVHAAIVARDNEVAALTTDGRGSHWGKIKQDGTAEIPFSNDSTLVGTLSSDGKEIKWSNNTVWKK